MPPHGESETNQPLILDQEVLDILSDSIGAEMMADLVAQSIEGMRTCVGHITGWKNDGDISIVKRKAHVLKGILQHIAEALDAACRENTQAEIVQLVKKFAPIAEQAYGALEERYNLEPAGINSNAAAN